MNTRFLVLMAIAVLVYFVNLNGSSIYILDEAKNASCAMEMAERNDWVVPTFNGELRTDKPPLHYYAMRLAYFVSGGITPGAARFFSAVCGVLMIMLVYGGTKRILNEPIAFWSSLILLSSVQLSIQFRLAVPDPYLILAITSTLYCTFLGIHGNRKAMVGAYAFAALAFLCKGLIALVLPSLVVFVYLIVTRRLSLKTINLLRLQVGIPLFAIIALPWYIAVGVATDGAWLHGFFVEHNVSRYTSTMEGHSGFPLAPFAIMIVALLPFSLVVVPAIINAVRHRAEQPFILFALIVVAVVGIFFSISRTMLPSYPAPALPFLAIVLGAYIQQVIVRQDLQRLAVNVLFLIASVIALGVPAGIYIALKQEVQLMILTGLAWVFTFLPVGSFTAWFLFFRNRSASLYVLALTWTMVSIVFFTIAYPQVDALNPVSMAMKVKEQQYKDLPLLSYKRFNPAFVFQARQPIDVVNSDQELKAWLDRNGDAFIISRADVAMESEVLNGLTVAYRGRDLFERTETVVLVSHKKSAAKVTDK
ncbi:glycosyltransferase family 39 protein [Chryseolinea sp. T2]|uniref:ArnT family glycosyltransferase n=1 Tax=Chryseolinea sp. T2 TaxID=3129255 RepID=UPI003077B771